MASLRRSHAHTYHVDEWRQADFICWPMDRGFDKPIIEKGPIEPGSDRPIIEKGPIDRLLKRVL